MIIEKTENGIYKMLDLSGLPKHEWYGATRINWRALNKHKVNLTWGNKNTTVCLSYNKKLSIDKKMHTLEVEIENHVRFLRYQNIVNLNLHMFFRKRIPTHLHKYILKESDKHLLAGSSEKIKCVCTSCGRRKSMAVKDLSKRGFSCNLCRTKNSLPESIVKQVLQQNSIQFIPQYIHERLPNRKFDFYLEKEKVFIEVDGEQHYTPSFGDKNFNKTRISDKEKVDFCIKNNLKLVRINARKSEVGYILKNLKKELGLECKNKKALLENIYDEKISHRNSEIVNLYKRGKCTKEIAYKYNLSSVNVRHILNNHGITLKRNHGNKKIVCINNKVVFSSIRGAARHHNFKSASSLYNNLSHRNKSAGKHLITGEPLKWMYYEDYIEKYGTEGLTEYI